MGKTLDVIFFDRVWSEKDWQYDHYENLESALCNMLGEIKKELAGFDIDLRIVKEDLKSEIRGYGDLLNSMRISFLSAGVASYCLGHIICQSKNLDILEDLRRGINRVAFAPETVEPAGSDKVVCHNCGCGC